MFFPALEVTGLEFQKTSAGDDEEEYPEEFATDAQRRVEELGSAEAEKDDREEIRRGTDKEITDARENGPEWPDKVLCRAVRRGKIAPSNPGRKILGCVGDQSEKQESPNTKKDKGEDFIPGVVFYGSSHR